MGQQNISSCFFFFFKPNLWPKANQSSILHLSISYLSDFTNTLHGFAAGRFSFCFLFCFFFKKEKKALKSLQGETLCLLLRLCTRNTHQFALEANPMN